MTAGPQWGAPQPPAPKAPAATAKFEYDIPKGATGKLDIEVQPVSGRGYGSWHWVGPLP